MALRCFWGFFCFLIPRTIIKNVHAAVRFKNVGVFYMMTATSFSPNACQMCSVADLVITGRPPQVTASITPGRGPSSGFTNADGRRFDSLLTMLKLTFLLSL